MADLLSSIPDDENRIYHDRLVVDPEDNVVRQRITEVPLFLGLTFNFPVAVFFQIDLPRVERPNLKLGAAARSRAPYHLVLATHSYDFVRWVNCSSIADFNPICGRGPRRWRHRAYCML